MKKPAMSGRESGADAETLIQEEPVTETTPAIAATSDASTLQPVLEDATADAATAEPPVTSPPSVPSEPQELNPHVDGDGFPLPERMHEGLHYLEVIGRIDTILKPGNYLEIGTHDGASLKRVSCTSISIDPQFVIDSDVIGSKPECHIFQMTSDRFFELHDPKTYFGGPVKFAFLDGMHRFEFLLRDLINTEKHCTPNSVILLHDCFPLNVTMTERVYDGVSRPGYEKVKSRDDLKRPAFWWTGDVWKVLWILAKYRPEIIDLHLNAAPTGLVALTGLNPESQVLSENYFHIVHEFGNMELDEELLKQHYEKFRLIDAAELTTESQLTRCFWF